MKKQVKTRRHGKNVNARTVRKTTCVSTRRKKGRVKTPSGQMGGNASHLIVQWHTRHIYTLAQVDSLLQV